MPTPFESAQLNLQIFEIRREPVLREARNWFLFDFHPESFEDLVNTIRSERNAAFRMVITYWEMAASMVTAEAMLTRRREALRGIAKSRHSHVRNPEPPGGVPGPVLTSITPF